MKHIIKGNEPQSLKKYRLETPNATYKGLSREEVRKKLIEEQGAICAYCMCRISNNKNKKANNLSIEHYRSQYRHKNFELTYNNMLGVCNGNAGGPSNKLICDKSKSKFDRTHDLTVDPLMVERINQIKYTKEGEIHSNNKDINRDLNEILNLNEQQLKEERSTVYKHTKKKIKSFWAKAKGNRTKVRSLLLSEMQNLDSKDFSPLCGVSIYLINKQLAKV